MMVVSTGSTTGKKSKALFKIAELVKAIESIPAVEKGEEKS